MSLRSDSRKVYAVRMAFVVLFCLAVHALIVSEFLGGGSTLSIWKPERMRVALASLIIIGIAAYEFRPKTKEDDPDEGLLPAPVAEKDVEASVAGAGASRPREKPTVEPASRAEDLRGRDTPAPCAVPPPAPVVRAAEDDAVPGVSAVDSDRRAVAWDKAREMPHNFVPDPDADYEYLRLVHDAARAGSRRAMVKLADYARRRRADVESYYWLTMAKIHGAEGLDKAITYCRNQWKVNGFNPEYGNEYVFFTERQGVLGRAALRLDSGVDATMARARLKAMIADGDREAKLILEHCGG